MIFKVEGLCPKCKSKGKSIKKQAMMNHVDDISFVKDFDYYVCMESSCEVVYFNIQNEFLHTQMNKELGYKNYSSEDATVCYCYGLKKNELNEHSVGYLETKMEEYPRACGTRNPTGKCCKGYIKKMINE